MKKDIALRLLLPALVIAATYFGLELSKEYEQTILTGQTIGDTDDSSSNRSLFSSEPFPISAFSSAPVTTSAFSSAPITSAFSSAPISQTSSSRRVTSASSSSTTTSQVSSQGQSSTVSQQSSQQQGSSTPGDGGDVATFDGDEDTDDGFGTTGGESGFGTNGTTGTIGGAGVGGAGVGGMFCVGGVCTPSIITKGIPGCNFEQGIIDARKCLPAFLAHLIRFVFGFAAGICILMIAFAGYEIVLGNLPGGSSEAGKNRLTWAIIGFIMAATSFFIMDFVISSIGG